MDSALLDVISHQAPHPTRRGAASISRRALAGDWNSVADRPWQHLVDETIVQLTWRAGAEELDALIDAILACSTERQRGLGVRDLVAWTRALLSDRDLAERYVDDSTIPAQNRTALARDLAANSARIEQVLDLLAHIAGQTIEAAPASRAMPRSSGVVLDEPDPASIEMTLRARLSTIERRLTALLGQLESLSSS